MCLLFTVRQTTIIYSVQATGYYQFFNKLVRFFFPDCSRSLCVNLESAKKLAA
jgi:hypothetical protein